MAVLAIAIAIEATNASPVAHHYQDPKPGMPNQPAGFYPHRQASGSPPPPHLAPCRTGPGQNLARARRHGEEQEKTEEPSAPGA